MSIGVVIAGIVVGLIVGFVIGSRGRHALMILKAMAELKKKLAEAGAGEDDADDDKVDEEDEEMGKEDPILDSLFTEAEPGLDDHQDTVLNPILLYQIKRAKDEMKERARLAALEGGEEVVAVGPKEGKLRVLTDKGALRFLKGKKGIKDGGEAEVMAKIRENLKSIDTFMETTYEVDTKRVAPPKMKRTAAGGIKRLDALGKVNDLKYNPLDGDRLQKESAIAEYAKRGRARVHPPLDHLIAAAGVSRRGSVGGGRRASCGGGGGGRRASTEMGDSRVGADPDAAGAIEGKLRRASALIGAPDDS